MTESTESIVIENQTAGSVWRSLISLIDKPAGTFAALLVRPRLKWALPLGLAILMTVITVWVSAPYSSKLAQKAAAQQFSQAGMSPEQAEAMMAQTARFQTPVFIGAIGSVTGALFLAVGWVVAAALLYFVSLVAGAEFNFGASFVVVAWSSLPITLRTLVQTILIAVAGKFPVYTGLAALQVSGDTLKDAANPMISLLSFADIFWLWHLLLLVVGLAVATKFSRLKAFFIVLIYALLSIGITVGLSLLSSGAA